MSEDKDTKHGNIHEALTAISRDAGAIGKDSRNAAQGFNFRGIDAVMNHLHPLFARHGVVILPEVIAERTEERETQKGGHLIYRVLTVKVRFAHASGSEASCIVIGEDMDSGDKASNKAMAVALKYALTQMLLLPYDEVDSDGDTPPESKPKATPKPLEPATAPAPASAAPREAGEIRTETMTFEPAKPSKTKSGKTVYRYRGGDEKFYSTFSADTAKAMDALVGEICNVQFEVTQNGQYENRKVLAVHKAPPPGSREPAEAAAPQDEDNLQF